MNGSASPYAANMSTPDLNCSDAFASTSAETGRLCSAPPASVLHLTGSLFSSSVHSVIWPSHRTAKSTGGKMYQPKPDAAVTGGQTCTARTGMDPRRCGDAGSGLGASP